MNLNFSPFHYQKDTSETIKCFFITLGKVLSVLIPLFILLYVLYGLLVKINFYPDQSAEILTSIASIFLIGGILYVIKKPSDRSVEALQSKFSSFAYLNGFLYKASSSEAPSLAVFGNTAAHSETISIIVSGTYKNIPFRIFVYEKSLYFTQRSPAFFGVLEVVMHDSKVANSSQATLEQKAKKLNGSQIELIGNRIYFVTKNGMDMRPEGISKLFLLIELVSTIQNYSYDA